MATDQKTPRKASYKLDISNLYRIEPDSIMLDITDERYSNLASVRVSEKDVYIDFLSLPGIKKEGKMVIRGTRIFMPHSSAKNLAESLTKILDAALKDIKKETSRSSKEKGSEIKKEKEEKP